MNLLLIMYGLLMLVELITAGGKSKDDDKEGLITAAPESKDENANPSQDNPGYKGPALGAMGNEHACAHGLYVRAESPTAPFPTRGFLHTMRLFRLCCCSALLVLAKQSIASKDVPAEILEVSKWYPISDA
ncbi:hypothetical protein FOZ60_011697 [Perkinsus olseni]|uniref:Secreted protein n=1 Tax=Perkinsus olseni TaxID=32597 RepID=A0A7J6NCS0_PEROL|nr:hypothetical protein FOZ60_011697 [Perkinsus olseni]